MKQKKIELYCTASSSETSTGIIASNYIKPLTGINIRTITQNYVVILYEKQCKMVNT